MRQLSHKQSSATALGIVALLLAPAAHAALYEIGPGKPYATLGAAPWSKLAPGDTVNIYWQPQAYHEKLLLSCRGTAAQPINIVGIPNASGALPVLDGQNATTSSQFQYPYVPTQDRGVVIFTKNTQQPWGYKPGYINLQNLDVRNANRAYGYTDFTGAARSYSRNAAAVFVERGEHIRVHGCSITGSGNGFFVASSGDEATLSRDIVLENSAVWGNGNVGSDREHNIYTEAIGTVFQFNYLGRPAPGALGNNLKDRSAGTVVRCNWIEGGGHLLDLVEAQESIAITGSDPSYHQTYVYGNTLIDGAGDAANLVHYGGDNGNTSTYRKGTLFFYHNTVVVQKNQTGTGGYWRTALFQISTNDETVDARNNILFSQPATPGAAPSECSFVGDCGIANLGVNWVSPNWLPAANGYTPFTGRVTEATRLTNTANNPGFAAVSGLDVHLTAISPCIRAGGALMAQESGRFGVYYQYQAPCFAAPRLASSISPDLGAFGVGEPISLPTYPLSGRVLCQGTGLGGVIVSAGVGAPVATAADGTYNFAGLLPGIYTISAAKDGYLLSPGQAVTLDAERIGVDFSAQATCHLSGRVLCQGIGMGGVTVNAGGNASTVTTADGTYAFAGLLPGSYNVSAVKDGYTFDGAQTVPLTSDKLAINFAGYPNVLPVQLVAFTLNSSAVKSYERPTAVLTLNRPVPNATPYAVVKLTSSNPQLVPVSDVQIWASQASKSISLTTSGVAIPTNVTITASCGGVTQTVVLTINPK